MPTVERGASQGRGQGHPPSLACCVLAFNVRCALTTPTPLLLFVLKSEVFATVLAIGLTSNLEFRWVFTFITFTVFSPFSIKIPGIYYSAYDAAAVLGAPNPNQWPRSEIDPP